MRNSRLSTVIVPEAKSFFAETDGYFGAQHRIFFDSDYHRAQVFNRNSKKRIAEYVYIGTMWRNSWMETETSGTHYAPEDFGGCGSIWDPRAMEIEKTVC